MRHIEGPISSGQPFTIHSFLAEAVGRAPLELEAEDGSRRGCARGPTGGVAAIIEAAAAEWEEKAAAV